MVRPGIVLALLAAVAGPASAQGEPVPVPGSAVKFPRAMAVAVGGQPVGLKLTGVALRTRAIFNVYAVGSYAPDGVTARSPEELAAADVPKVLYLVMERAVAGKDILEAFRTAMGPSQPGRFAAEFAQLTAAIGDQTAVKGDHVSLLYVPGVGLRVQIVGKVDTTVKGAEFARAVWEVYLGPKPIDDGIKRGLVGLLGK